ncbi:MAG: YDG domain-containing protein [Longibaculum sp.]
MNLVSATNQVNINEETTQKVITGFKDVEKDKALLEKEVYKDTEDLELPKEIEVILSDEKTEVIQITWESDKDALSTLGVHKYHLVLPEGYQLKDDSIQLPFININVIEKEEVPYITGFKDDGKDVYQTIDIIKGTLEKDIPLPKTITAIFSNNETKEIEVTWKTEKYDPENPQEKYQYHLVLPEIYQVKENIHLPLIEVNTTQDIPSVLSDSISTLNVVDGVVEVNTADEFIAAVKDGSVSTIKIKGNTTSGSSAFEITELTETLTINRKLTITSYNEEARNIYLSYGDEFDFITIENGGNLTIDHIRLYSIPSDPKEWDAKNWKMFNIETGGEVTTGEKFSFSHIAAKAQTTGIIDVHGTLTIQGGISEDKEEQCREMEKGDSLKGYIYVYADGNVIINGGTLSLLGNGFDGQLMTTSLVYNLGSVTVNGGTFKNIKGANTTISNPQRGNIFHNEGTLTINKGTFENNGKSDKDVLGGVAYNANGGNLVVNNGTFTNNSGKNGGVFYNADEGILEINGGEYKNNTAINGSILYCDRGSKTTVSSGYFDEANKATFGTFAYLSSKSSENGSNVVGSFVIKNKPMILGTISTIGFISGSGKYYEETATSQADDAHAFGVTLDNALAHAIIIEPRKIYTWGASKTLIDAVDYGIKYVKGGNEYRLRGTDRGNVQFLPYDVNQYAASLLGNSIVLEQPTYEQVLKDVIYVDPINGTNGNSGADYSHGVKSLEVACQRVKPGGKIYVRPNSSSKWEYTVANDEILEPRGKVTIMACTTDGKELTILTDENGDPLKDVYGRDALAKVDVIIKKGVTLQIGDDVDVTYLNIENNGKVIKKYENYENKDNYYIQQPTPGVVCFKPHENRNVEITAKFIDREMFWSMWEKENGIFGALDTNPSSTLELSSSFAGINNVIGDYYFVQKNGYYNIDQGNLSNQVRVSVRDSWDISKAGLQGTNETVKGVHDGKITASGTELELMEYKLSTDNDYQEVGFGEREISGLKPGTYDIRYAGREETEAHTQITIIEGESLHLDVQLMNSELKTSVNSSYKDLISFGIKNNSNAPIRVLHVGMESNDYFNWYNGAKIQGADNEYYDNAPISAYLPIDIAAGGKQSSFGSEGDNTIRIQQTAVNFRNPGTYSSNIQLTIEVAGEVKEVSIPVILTVSAHTMKIEKKVGVTAPEFTKIYDGEIVGSYNGNLKDYYQIKLDGTTVDNSSDVYNKIKTTITYDNKNVGNRKTVTIKFSSLDVNYAIDEGYDTLTYTKGEITPKELKGKDLSVIQNHVITKEYDGTEDAILKSGDDFNFKNGSVIDGDDVSLQLKGWNYYSENASGNLVRDSSAGKFKIVKYADYSITAKLSGADKDNYTINTNNTSDFTSLQYTGEITKKKAILVLKEGKTFDKIYDGQSKIENIKLDDYFTIEGLPEMPEGKVTILYTNEQGEADKNAGQKTLAFGDIKFSNPKYQPDSISKYFEYSNSGYATYPNLSISLKQNTATINQKKLTVERTTYSEPFTKEYDGTNKAVNSVDKISLTKYFKLSGYIEGEYPHAVYSGTYQSKDVSDNNPITLDITDLDKITKVNYSIDRSTFEIPGKIEKKSVSIILNDLKPITKYYDGTTDVLGTNEEGFVKLLGVINGETLIPKINSIAYASPNVGSVNINYDITLSAGDNTDLSNYKYIGKFYTSKGEIIKPEFKIQLNADRLLEKVYDGTTDCQFNSDDFTVTIPNSNKSYKIQSATLSYDKTGVNASKVTMSNIVIEGADLDLQTVPETVEFEGKITPKPLTINQISPAMVTKEYDGTTIATIEKGVHYQIEGIIGNDDVSLDTEALYNSKDVTDASQVTVTIKGLLGWSKDNYILKNNDSLTYVGKITPKPIALTDKKTITKYYDREKTVTIDNTNYKVNGVLTGENITVKFDAVFEDEKIGENKPIHCSQIQLIAGDNTNANNYKADESSFVFTGNIVAQKLILKTGNVATKEYDGTTNATVTKDNYQLMGIANGDDVDITFNNAHYNNKNSSQYNISISFDNLRLTGKDADKYTINPDSTINGKIERKVLTIKAKENAPIITKEYDGDDRVTTSIKKDTYYIIDGLAAGEEMGFFNFSTLAYENADVSDSNNVIITWRTWNEIGDNYKINAGQITLLGKITPAKLNVQLNSKFSKQYDGNANANINDSDLKLMREDGTVVNLNTTVKSAAFADMEVGTDKELTLSLGELTLPNGSTEKPSNYTLASEYKLKGDITAIPVTIKQIQGALVIKDYDGTDTTKFDGTKFELTSILDADKDKVTLNAKGIQYTSANASTLLNLSLIEPTLEGDAAKHYMIENPTYKEFVGKINKKDVTVTSLNTTLKKTYDGTVNITASEGTDYVVNGIIDKDKEKVQLDYSIALNDKNVKNANKATMTFSGLKGNATVIDNYNLKTTALELNAQVLAFPVKFTANNVLEKDYNGDTTVTIQDSDYTLSAVNGESLTLVLGLASYDSPNAGPRIVIAEVKGLEKGNAQTDVNNYSFEQVTVTFTGRIKGLQVTVTPKNTITKVYDGTNNATISQNNYTLSGVPTDKTFTINAKATYDKTDVTATKVTATNIQLEGEGAESYEVYGNVEFIGSITPRPLTAKSNEQIHITKVYDGNKDITIAEDAYTFENLIQGDNVTATSTAHFIDENAGKNKEITATLKLTGTDSQNYTLTNNKITLKGDITKKNVDAVWEVKDQYVYNGIDQTSGVKAYYIDISGNKQYVKVQCQDDKTFVNADQYTFEVVNDLQNYNLLSNTKQVTMSPASIEGLTITGIDAKGYAHTGSNIEIPTIGIEGLKNTDFNVTYNNNKNLGENAEVVLTGKGNYTGRLKGTFTIYASEYPGDVLPTEGRNENGYYKENITITIPGHTVGKDYEQTQEAIVLSTEGHPTKESIYIVNKQTEQIYQKEVEYYLDKTNPIIHDLDADKTYYVDTPFTVTDENQVIVTIDGTKVTDYVIKGNINHNYSVIATDEAGNTALITISVKSIDSLVDKTITKDNIKSSDKEKIQSQIDTLKAIDQTHATQDQKDEIQKWIDYCEDLLKDIENLQQDFKDIQDKVNSFDKDKITYDHYEDLKGIHDKLQDMIQSDHYTESEKEELNKLLDKVNEMIKILDNFKQQVKNIEEKVHGYTKDNVKETDIGQLDVYLEEIEKLLENSHVSENQEKRLNELKEYIQKLKDIIEDLNDKLDQLDEVKDLTPDNVNMDIIDKMKDVIEDIETNYPNNMTDDQKKELEELKDKLDDLKKVLDDLENKVKELEDKVHAYTTENVKDTDRETLNNLKNEINDLLDNTRLTENQKDRLNDLIEYIDKLIDILDKLNEKLDKLDPIHDLTIETVGEKDREVINQVKDVIQDILDNHSHNLTSEEEKYVQEVIEKIKDLEDAIKDIEELIKDIHKVVDPLTPDNVKDTDREKLNEMKDQIKDLIDNKHLSEDQMYDLNQVIDKIKELENKLNDFDEKFDKLDLVKDINKDNVSKDDQDVIDFIKDIINDIEKNYPDNMTDNQKDKLDEIKNKLDELQKVIDDIQDKIDKIKDDLKPLTPETIKSSDRDKLDEIKKEIDNLLNSDQLTDDQRKQVNDLNDYINDLYDRINALDKLDEIKDKLDYITPDNVKDTDKEILDDLKDQLDDLSKNDSITDKQDEIKDLQDKIKDLEDKLNDLNDKFNELDKAEDINSNNVSKDDQEVIDQIKDIIEDIEKNYPNNMTDDQKNRIDEIKDKLEDLQETIDQVKDVEKDINSLDKKENYTDEEKEMINKINDKYESLTNHQKDMVNPLLTDKLKAILEIVRKKYIKDDQYQFVVEGIGQTDFDINTTLLVKKITEQLPSTMKQAIYQSLNNTEELKDVYDIQLLLDGQAIQPDGKIRIKIPLTDQQKLYQNIHLYYISDRGEMTEIKYTRDGNVIIFETDHLSYYAIVADKETNNSSKGSQTVKTEDQNNILGLEILLGASIYLLILLRKKKEI